MKVELKFFTHSNGGQFVMIIGTSTMPRLYVDSLDFPKEITAQSCRPTSVKDRGLYGWIMCNALALRVTSNIVDVTDGDLITVDIMKMPVSFVSQMVSICSHGHEIGNAAKGWGGGANVIFSFCEIDSFKKVPLSYFDCF